MRTLYYHAGAGAAAAARGLGVGCPDANKFDHFRPVAFPERFAA